MNKVRFFSIILVSFLTYQQFLFAQRIGVISGKIYSWYPDPEPIKISLLSQNGSFIEETFDAQNGDFMFRFVSSGSYRLKFESNYHRTFLSDIFYVSDAGKSGLSYELEPTTPILISWLYTYMVLDPEKFPQYVSDDRNLINSDKNFYSCINGIVNLLSMTAARAPTREQAMNHAIGIAGRSNVPPELAREVGKTMPNTSPAVLAEYLSALSNFVQQILAGNTVPYYNSSIYKTTSLWVNTQKEYAPILEIAIKAKYGISYRTFLSNLFFFCVDYTYFYVGISCQ